MSLMLCGVHVAEADMGRVVSGRVGLGGSMVVVVCVCVWGGGGVSAARASATGRYIGLDAHATDAGPALAWELGQWPAAVVG